MQHQFDEATWRERFRGSALLILVDFLTSSPSEQIRRLAGEELDRQLIAAGFRPNLH